MLEYKDGKDVWWFVRRDAEIFVYTWLNNNPSKMSAPWSLEPVHMLPSTVRSVWRCDYVMDVDVLPHGSSRKVLGGFRRMI